jgi:hypothetical protein
MTASTSPPMPRSQASFWATNCSTKLKPNAATAPNTASPSAAPRPVR